MVVTIGLALTFIIAQAYEYTHAPFSISDGIYGTIFYTLTGLHGMHVIVGIIFLWVVLAKFYYSIV